jgi:1,4-dihydroxy-2-naphthoyl-CoA hydrolase
LKPADRLVVNGKIEFRIVEQSQEQVVGEMPVQPGILNPYGVVHAGALLWFADVCATTLALGGADASPGGSGFPLAIDLHAAFLANQKDGVLKARAGFLKRGRRVSVVRTTVTGNGGRLLADVTTTHVPAGTSAPAPQEAR